MMLRGCAEVTPPAVLATILVTLWVFSRAVVFLIDRTWPPFGAIFRVDGLDVHVLDLSGEAGAPAVVAIHGASGNLREPVEALRDTLQGRFRLIAVDRPGHGHTSRGRREMSDPGRQADLVDKALGRLGAGLCVIVGHSWGAAVAVALAQRHPGRVSGLVLVAPATHPWPGSLSVRTRLGAMPYLGRIGAELFVVPVGMAIIGGTIRAIFEPDPVPLRYCRRIGGLLAIRPKTYVANCRDIVDLYGHLVRQAARYDEIRVPCEILTGDRDTIVSPAIHSYGLARDIRGARLTILPGAGHMPHWSRGDDVAAAVYRVLAAGERAARAAE